jgi:hypothetical protein
MFHLQEPYTPRPIRFLELWQPSGWRLKVYGIAYQQPLPRAEVIAGAQHLVNAQLATLSAGKRHYGVGFMGIHDGRGAIFLFLDFWADENELHHHVFVAPKDQPDRHEYATPSGLAACVWDLRVLCFEREAWLNTMLANPNGPNLNAYLVQRLNEDA